MLSSGCIKGIFLSSYKNLNLKQIIAKNEKTVNECNKISRKTVTFTSVQYALAYSIRKGRD